MPESRLPCSNRGDIGSDDPPLEEASSCCSSSLELSIMYSPPSTASLPLNETTIPHPLQSTFPHLEPLSYRVSFTIDLFQFKRELDSFIVVFRRRLSVFARLSCCFWSLAKSISVEVYISYCRRRSSSSMSGQLSAAK